MKRTNGNWLVNKSANQIGMPDNYSIVSKLENGDFVHLANITGIDTRNTTQALIEEYDTQRQANANLMASAPRLEKKIEEALEKLIWMEQKGSSDSYEGYAVTEEVRNILCDHSDKEYQAEEPENNVPESLHCINCNKEFNVQDEQEAMLENEREV